MKYIDADCLRKAVEKKYNSNDTVGDRWDLGYDTACEQILEIIDSLQQEQMEVDLKEETKEWVNLMVGASFPEQDGDFISEEDYRSVIRQIALHFYELGKNSK